MSSEDFTAVLLKYEDDIRGQIEHHSKYRTLDSGYYNGITAVILLLSALIAMLPPGEGFWLMWTPKVFGAITSFWLHLIVP